MYGNRTDRPKDAIYKYIDGHGWAAFPGWFAQVFDQLGFGANEPFGALTPEQLQQIHPELLNQVAWNRPEQEVGLEKFYALSGLPNPHDTGFNWRGAIGFAGGAAPAVVGTPGVPGSGVTGIPGLGSVPGIPNISGAAGGTIIKNILANAGVTSSGASAVSQYVQLMARMGITGRLFDAFGRPLYNHDGSRLNYDQTGGGGEPGAGPGQGGGENPPTDPSNNPGSQRGSDINSGEGRGPRPGADGEYTIRQEVWAEWERMKAGGNLLPWQEELGNTLARMGVRGPYFGQNGEPFYNNDGTPSPNHPSVRPDFERRVQEGSATEGTTRGERGTGRGRVGGAIVGPPIGSGGPGASGTPTFSTEGRATHPDRRGSTREPDPEPPWIKAIDHGLPLQPPLQIPPWTEPGIKKPPPVEPPMPPIKNPVDGGGGGGGGGIGTTIPGINIPPIGGGNGGGSGPPMPPGFVGAIGGGQQMDTLMRFDHRTPFIPPLGYFLRGGN